MKDIKCIYAKEISVNNIIEVEKQVNYKFPEEFVHFIIKNSGGYPMCNRIDIEEDTESVNNFLDFSEEGSNYIVKTYSCNKGLQVQNCIPFARDAGSNYYCFDRNDNSILFWDHEECDEENGPFCVCDTFEEFIESLYEEENEML